MKKYVIVFCTMMLTACHSFIGAKVHTTPVQDVVITANQNMESELDLALPIILANAEKNYSPVQTTPMIIIPANTDTQLPKAVDGNVLDVRQYSQDDLRCLAVNIYHESRGEPVRGQVAVAWVVLNRVHSGRYARTVCGVVYQRSRKGCQFHWVCDRNPDQPKEMKAFERAQLIAKQVLRGEVENPIGRRLSFHTTSYRGRYNAHGKSHVVVGQHLFY